MGILDKIIRKSSDKEKSNNILLNTINLEKIGEIDRCPNCQTKLEYIPKRKKRPS